jgi:hypothetical protein
MAIIPKVVFVGRARSVVGLMLAILGRRAVESPWTVGPWRASTVSVFSCSADGNYEVTLMTKATVYYNGLVVWQPPAVYKSSCAIDVEFFPYDVQTCVLKLGSWTYDGFKVREVLLLTGVCLENCAPCTYRLFTLGKGIKLTVLLTLCLYSQMPFYIDCWPRKQQCQTSSA